MELHNIYTKNTPSDWGVLKNFYFQHKHLLQAVCKYMNNDNQVYILNYLKYPWSTNGYFYKSPYMAALVEARNLTKRDEQTGIKIDGEHGCWTGALGYMILVDHIGSIFTNKDFKNINDDRTFTRALKHFTNLSDEEINILYALRCSFAHNFTLFNINKKNNQLQHQFTVTSGSMSGLIIPPQIKWDGNHKNKNEENRTIVNIELLGDLVETMHLKITQLARENKIEYINEDLIKTFIVYK